MSDGSRSRSESESSEDAHVFCELGMDPAINHFVLDEELSTQLRRVFKCQELDGHETMGLSDIMTMMRGTPDEYLPLVHSVYLGLKDPQSNAVGVIGKSESRGRDPRVLGIQEWTQKIPLPLGGSTYAQLRIVFHLHAEIPLEHFKICADVVPVPRQFLESADSSGRPKMKRILGWGKDPPSILRLLGGTILTLEQPRDALDPTLPELNSPITLVQPTETKTQPMRAVSERLYSWSELVRKYA
jgi:hypothetical protein